MIPQKRIFVAATRQDDGKSTICLGLLQILKEKYPQVGFMKPVGQRYVEHEGVKVDEDVILMREVCGITNSLKDMNPITVGKGFTENYLLEGGLERYKEMIMKSYACISKDKELMLIEGTGHAGVGAVFDLSNASIAKLLGGKVILVSTGGIGRPIDEIVINKALFDQEGVEIIGVVINKVLLEKYDKIKKITKIGLERKGIKLLGVIPFMNRLTYPTMEQIMEAIKGRLLYGGDLLQKKVARILIGAMQPCHALGYFAPHSLIIVPGDREDIILAAIAREEVLGEDYEIAGMILTGDLLPHQGVWGLLEKGRFPVFLSEDDTYTTAKKVHECRVKIRAKDEDKIKEAAQLTRDFLNIDEIVSRI